MTKLKDIMSIISSTVFILQIDIAVFIRIRMRRVVFNLAALIIFNCGNLYTAERRTEFFQIRFRLFSENTTSFSRMFGRFPFGLYPRLLVLLITRHAALRKRRAADIK